VATIKLARDEIAACYTFGSPRVGDRSFDAYVKPPHYRVVNHLDCVPLVPFAFMKYRHGGDARYIRKGTTSAARWSRPVLRALLVNFVGLIEIPFRRSLVGVRDHDIRGYGEILYGIARERGAWD
jgi:triacylglycerol lipase